MKIAIGKETAQAEKRVAASPDSVRKLIALGAEVFVETGAGALSSFPDSQFEAAGAKVVAQDEAYKDADVVLRVRSPSAAEVGKMKKGALLIGMLAPYNDKEFL